MNSIKLIALVLVTLTACGRTILDTKTVRDGEEVLSSSVYDKDRWGDETYVEEVDIGRGRYGRGYHAAPGVLPIGQPQTYIAVTPNITYGQRAKQEVSGGRIVLVPVADTRQQEEIDKLKKQQEVQQQLLELHEESIQDLEP